MAVEEAIALAFVGSSGIFAYIALNLDKRHSLLGWIFLPLSVVMSAMSFIILTEYETSSAINKMLSGTSSAILLVTVFVIAYFLIFLLIKAFSSMAEKDPYKNRL